MSTLQTVFGFGSILAAAICFFVFLCSGIFVVSEARRNGRRALIAAGIGLVCLVLGLKILSVF